VSRNPTHVHAPVSVGTSTHTEILQMQLTQDYEQEKNLLTMKNQFHGIPVKIRKINNEHSEVCILLQLLGTGCKPFLHYRNLKYKSDCTHAASIYYCTQNELQHPKINRHTYLSSRHKGLSRTICRLTFGPTRSRMLFSPYMTIVGLKEN
jgi:hypothetical protein